MIRKKLKEKDANAVEGTFIIIMILLISFFLTQFTMVLTTNYKLRQNLSHTLTLFETQLTETEYKNLTNKNFTSYKKDIITSYSDTLYVSFRQLYEEKLAQNENLVKVSGSSTYYESNYYKLYPNSISMFVTDVTDTSVTFEVVTNVTYKIYLPFVNDYVDFKTGQITVESTYNFINDIGEDSTMVSGETSGYDSQLY